MICGSFSLCRGLVWIGRQCAIMLFSDHTHLIFINIVDFFFIVTPIVRVCNCSMFCRTLPFVHSCIAIILMEKRELVALLNLSSLCIVMVGRLFLVVPRGCLQFVIVVFPGHTHYFCVCHLDIWE